VCPQREERQQNFGLLKLLFKESRLKLMRLCPKWEERDEKSIGEKNEESNKCVVNPDVSINDCISHYFYS